MLKKFSFSGLAGIFNGASVKFHSDCFKEINEKFGIEACTSIGVSPFGNGVVDKSNGILYETMIKTKEDAKCNIETALTFAVWAKNSLRNWAWHIDGTTNKKSIWFL